MNGDFSRFSHKRSKHYSRVLKQQGRVDLDADHNEQVEIQQHMDRATRRDLVGHSGYPIANGAFRLEPTPEGNDLFISPGRFYVDGLLVEVDATPLPVALVETPALPGVPVVEVAAWLEVPEWEPDGRPFAAGQWIELDGRGVPPLRRVVKEVKADKRRIQVQLTPVQIAQYGAKSAEATLRRVPTYRTQPDAPEVPALSPGAGKTVVLFLEVFERHVSEVEDPDLKEKAIGGPDTTTRVKTVWRVLAHDAAGALSCADDVPNWPPKPGEGRLTTDVAPDPASDNPCVLPPQGGYRAIENRLYRVEIHDAGDAGGATFKWSRDNGAVTYAIAGYDEKDSKKVTLRRLGRDRTVALQRDDWVEILDDRHELAGRPGQMVQVADVDPATDTVTLAGAVAKTAPHLRPKLRRWDMKTAPQKAQDAVTELEAGVRVRFSGKGFRTGDWWAFAARVADRSVERLHAAPPMGTRRRHAKLGLLTLKSGKWHVHDCRRPIRPLTEPCGTCSVTVGDGVTSHGDFTDLQQAVDFAGGLARVCILPGVHRLADTVQVEGLQHLVIEGSARQARVHAPPGKPALRIVGCDGVTLQEIHLEAGTSEGAIVVERSRRVTIRRCEVENTTPVSTREDEREAPPRSHDEPWPEDLPIDPAAPAAADDGDDAECDPYGPAIDATLARRLVVRECLLVGSPAVRAQARGLLVERSQARGGGIHVRDGSAAARILHNLIAGGRGAGVHLGEAQRDPALNRGVHQVEVRGNRIHMMGGPGVASTLPALDGNGRPQGDDPEQLVPPLTDVSVEENEIRACGWEKPPEVAELSLLAGVMLLNAKGLRVRGNRVVETGRKRAHRASGIMVLVGRAVEVCGNTVRDNGALPPTPHVREVDFALRPTGEEAGSTRIENHVRFEVVDGEGRPARSTRVVRMDNGRKALDCGYGTTVTLPAPARRVELTLAAGSDATVVARSSEGSAEKQVASGFSGEVVLLLDRIHTVEIHCGSNEMHLERLVAIESVHAKAQAGIMVQMVDARMPEQAFLARLSQSAGAKRLARIRTERGATTYRRFRSAPLRVVRPRSWGPLAAKVHDNVVSCPSGPALVVRGKGLVSVTDNVLASEGVEEPFDDPGRCVQVSESGLAARLDLRAFKVLAKNAGPSPTVDGQPAPAVTEAPPEGKAAGRMRLHMAEPGIRFSGNQVSLRAALLHEDVVRSSVSLRTVSDLLMHDNHLAGSLGDGGFLQHAEAEGSTVTASGNRLVERGSAKWSLRVEVRRGGIVMGNQADHCILALPQGSVRAAGNLVLEVQEEDCKKLADAEARRTA